MPPTSAGDHPHVERPKHLCVGLQKPRIAASLPMIQISSVVVLQWCRWFMINSSKNSVIVSQKKSCPPSRVIIAPWHIPDHQSWHPNLAVSPSLRGLSLRLPGLVAALLSCIGCTSDHQYSIVYGILNITSILRGFRAMSYRGNFTFPPRIESPLSLHRTALQQIGGRFARLG